LKLAYRLKQFPDHQHQPEKNTYNSGILASKPTLARQLPLLISFLFGHIFSQNRKSGLSRSDFPESLQQVANKALAFFLHLL